MSHYSQVKTNIKRKSTLIRALQSIDNGRWKNKIEICETPQNLYGYQGDKRGQKADLIIRRQHVGNASNDIGFVKQEDGTYEAIISDYDSSKYSKSWLDKLTREYSKHTVTEVAEEQGFTWTQREENGEIYVTCESNF